MNDPHVKSLQYCLATDDTVSFEAPAITYETDTFKLHLEDDVLTVDLKTHFATVREARSHIEEFLGAWEVDMALQYGKREVAFDYEDAEVVDRDPPPPGESSTAISVCGTTATATATAHGGKAHIKRPKYPEPPSQFRLSPDARTLWQRYEGYKDGREPLFSMAYFCLTLLETRAGNRETALQVFNISYDVLDTLGKLSANRGDDETARKVTSQLKPATGAEKRWTEHAIRALIKQVGICDGGNTPEKLTMADLPELT